MVGRAPAAPNEAAGGEVMSKASSANATPMRKLTPTAEQRAAALKGAKEMAGLLLSPTSPPAKHDWKSHAKRINASWQKGVESILETGRLLIDAKNDLNHGEWGEMIQLKLSFGSRTAHMLMAIAGNPELSNRKHVSDLPPSWGTLYELTKLPGDALKTALAKGAINPKTQRKDVAAMLPLKHAPEKTKQQKSTAMLPSNPKNMEIIEPLTLRVATRHYTIPLHPRAQALPEPTEPTEHATGDRKILIQEINTFHRELVGFLNDFTQRFTTWHQADPPIDKDGKAAIMQALYLCADGFARLAQEFDGR
jgi:DUF3102 family protein